MLILHLCGEVALVPALLHLQSGPLHQPAHDHGRPGSCGGTGVHHLGGVWIFILNIVDGNAQGSGADLAQAGLEALTHLRGANEDLHLVAGLGEAGVRLDNGLLPVAGECAAVVVHSHADTASAAGLVLSGLSPVV